MNFNNIVSLEEESTFVKIPRKKSYDEPKDKNKGKKRNKRDYTEERNSKRYTED